jgi:hypothetical protein
MKKLCCNSCGQSFDGGSVGTACPQCGEGVLIDDSPNQSISQTTPRLPPKTTPAFAHAEVQRSSETADSREVRKKAAGAETNAVWLMAFGIALILIGVIVTIFTGVAAGSGCFAVGGTFLSIGFFENIRAQILHIRANLERR